MGNGGIGMRRGISRFRQLSPVERRALLDASVRYGIVMCVLRTAGLKRCLSWINRVTASGKFDRQSDVGSAQIDSLVLAVQRACAAWGRGACLDRALTLCWLLRRAGLPADLQLGVRKHDNDLAAHAWVELGGRRLGDDGGRGADYATFEPIIS